jgi:hypothetical protein
MLDRPQIPKESYNIPDGDNAKSFAIVNRTKQFTVEEDSVLGLLRYLPAGHKPEVNENRIQLPALREFSDERLLPLHNIRPIPTITELNQCANYVQLHTYRFTAVQHPIRLNKAPYTTESFKNPQLLKQHLVPATVEMLKQVTGCKTVMIDTVVLRDALYSDDDAVSKHDNQKDEPADLTETFPQFIGFDRTHGGATPAPKVHTDYTSNGARNLLRYYHPLTTEAAADIISHEDALLAAGKNPIETYKDSGGPRWALYSIWRPLRTVKRDPLAVADYRSVDEEDYVPLAVKYPRLGLPGKSETYDSESIMAKYSEGHKWYWIDSQTAEEIWVVKFFDSDDEKAGSIASGGAFHSSVHLPGTENEEPRESLECRVTCIW